MPEPPSVAEKESKKTAPNSLLRQILNELHIVFALRLRLARAEMENEIRRRVPEVLCLGAGVGAMSLFMIFALMGLVHFLHWATSPASSDAASLPVWGCFAIVAIFLALIGSCFFYCALLRKRQRINA